MRSSLAASTIRPRSVQPPISAVPRRRATVGPRNDTPRLSGRSPAGRQLLRESEECADPCRDGSRRCGKHRCRAADRRAGNLLSPVKLRSHTAVGQAVLRQAERPVQTRVACEGDGRAVVGVEERPCGIGFGTDDAAARDERVGRRDVQQFVEAPRLAAHEDARLRQGVVEQITSGSGQCPFVGMQAVEQGGRFDVGARLPQPLRAREEQRLLLPQRQQPQRRREQHQRRDYDRRQHGPFEVCRMQFHLFVAAFYAVDRPFAFEIERVAVGARQAESRGRVAQAQFVLSAADRQDVERLPAGRHRRQVRELHPLAAFRFGFSGRRQAAHDGPCGRCRSGHAFQEGVGIVQPQGLGDDLRCRRSVGRGSDIRRGGSCRREDPPRHDAPDSHDGCEQQTGRPARFHGSADSGLSDFSGSSGTGSSATVSRSAGEEVS